MDVNAGVIAQPGQIVGQPVVILPAADTRFHFWIQRLNAHFELQCTSREFRDDRPQRFGQAVRNHFEVNEQAGRVTLKEELENTPADRQVQVERAIDELELLGPAIE